LNDKAVSMRKRTSVIAYSNLQLHPRKPYLSQNETLRENQLVVRSRVDMNG
jgi:hypothetical protein